MNTKHQPTPCPKCGASLNTAHGLDADTKPRLGYVTVCVYCGAVLQFAVNAFCLVSPDAPKLWHPDAQADLALAQKIAKQVGPTMRRNVGRALLFIKRRSK